MLLCLILHVLTLVFAEEGNSLVTLFNEGMRELVNHDRIESLFVIVLCECVVCMWCGWW